MAIIKIRKSSTPNAKPSSLEYGELALNYSDKELYFKDNNGSIVGCFGDIREHIRLIEDELNGVNTAIGSGELML